MSELVEFIRGCLDADEQTARAIVDSDPRWLRLDEGPPWHCDEQSDHVAFSPARVLAEVNAKRAILDKYERASVAFEQSVNPATSAAVMVLAEVVDAMAQPFAGEPGWRDEWGTQ